MQPRIGDYLMSQTRPRNAYLIVHVRELTKNLDLVVERVSATDVPEGATVHPWKWDARKKTCAVRSART
jgi:hypothetical protein